jgi:Uncharacterized Zn-finger containing protein
MSMSGNNEFDKEAEREKLREKYERDEQKRQHTRQMSELLLKGATMTNRHCEQCGDPIFSHNGQEFCPTCSQTTGTDEQPAAGQAEANPQQQPQPGQGSTSASVNANTSPNTDAESIEIRGREDIAEGSQADVNPQVGSDGDQSNPEPKSESNSARGTAERAAARNPQFQTESNTIQPESPQGTVTGGETGGSAEGDSHSQAAKTTTKNTADIDLSAARESLVRSITKFAQAAEHADTPQQAQEHLIAAREAANALESVRSN